MLLLADGIGSTQPPLDVAVKLLFGLDADLMSVPARSIFFGLHKPGIVEFSRGSAADQQIRFARRCSSKPYAYLADDSGFLRIDPDRPTGAHDLRELLEHAKNVGLRTGKENREAVFSAGMPHIPGYKFLPALWTSPQGFELGSHGGVVLSLHGHSCLGPIRIRLQAPPNSQTLPPGHPTGVGHAIAVWLSSPNRHTRQRPSLTGIALCVSFCPILRGGKSTSHGDEY